MPYTAAADDDDRGDSARDLSVDVSRVVKLELFTLTNFLEQSKTVLVLHKYTSRIARDRVWSGPDRHAAHFTFVEQVCAVMKPLFQVLSI